MLGSIPLLALDHLHVVMRRLLLEQIVKMEDPIELTAGCLRPLEDEEVSQPNQLSEDTTGSRGSTKRKSELQDEQRSTVEKSKCGYDNMPEDRKRYVEIS